MATGLNETCGTWLCTSDEISKNQRNQPVLLAAGEASACAMAKANV